MDEEGLMIRLAWILAGFITIFVGTFGFVLKTLWKKIDLLSPVPHQIAQLEQNQPDAYWQVMEATRLNTYNTNAHLALIYDVLKKLREDNAKETNNESG